MKITDVRAHHIRIPYDAGPASFRQGASAISALDMVLVEVSTDAGLTGWGDAFAYVCPKTSCTAVAEMIAPQARGLDVPDAARIPAVMEQIQRNLHLFGRYGITMFAISALDIALWDLAGKVKGEPLHQLIGGAKRSTIPAYASLMRIGNAGHIAAECKKAIKLGYAAIKLHETTVPAVSAAREAIGPGVPLMVDMNCPLDGPAAIQFARDCKQAAPMFLEEPVWPPEDFATLAEVRREGRLDIAAGENACTVHQFRQMMTAGAVSHAQPSVIKVGGVTEFLQGGRARRRVRRPGDSALALFRAGLPRHPASDGDPRRRADRGVLHEAPRLPVGRSHRCRRPRPCRRAARPRPRLRAGSRRDGEVPGGVSAPGALRRHCEERSDEAIHPSAHAAAMDCFALRLAMTISTSPHPSPRARHPSPAARRLSSGPRSA